MNLSDDNQKEFESYRQLFPFFHHHADWIYLDSAATTHKPSSVVRRLSDFYEKEYATIHRGAYYHAQWATEQYEQARKKVASFIGAPHADEIVFTKGTTASLNLVARSWGKRLFAGDAIAISEIEHHANVVPWQMVCKERNLRLEIIPVDDNSQISVEAFQEILDRNVGLVSIAHMSNTTGVIHPIDELAQMAHDAGALICVDGAQAVAHMPVDVKALNCDFYAFSAHKLYGPTGLGVLWGKKDLLEAMEPLEGGGAMVDEVTLEKTHYAPPPRRFEAGTQPIAEVLAFAVALDFLSSIGMEKIEKWEKQLDLFAHRGLASFEGVRFLANPAIKGPITSWVIEGAHALDVATLLDAKKVALRVGHHCSQNTMARYGVTSTLRISFGLYNNLNEVENFLNRLKVVINLIRGRPNSCMSSSL